MIILYIIIAAVFIWFIAAPLFDINQSGYFEDSDNVNQKKRMEELVSDLELDFALNNISEAEYNKLKSSYDKTR